MVYTVIAVLEARPQKEIALKKVLMGLAALGKKELRCVEYILHERLNFPSTFICYTIWQSAQAFNAYKKEAPVISLCNKLDNLLGKPRDVLYLTEV